MPSIAFGADGSVYAATDCGVLRRPASGGAFVPVDGFGGRGPITAVAVTGAGRGKWVWARTPNAIILRRPQRGGSGGAITWQVTVFNAPTSAPATGLQTLSMAPGVRGMGFGFAVYGRRASVPVMVNVPGALSPRVGALELDPDAAQPWWIDWVNAGAGIGLGERVHLRSGTSAQFASRNGGRDPLLLTTAQLLYLGTPRLPPDGDVNSPRGTSWRLVAEAAWGDSGCSDTPPTNDCYQFTPTSLVHTDMWDAHVS